VSPSDVEVGAPTTSLLKIGEVAGRVGLSLRTIRYYEEVGLLEPTGRSPGGFRLYSEDEVTRLAILKGMKPLGLTLEEIRDLMGLLTAATQDDADGASHDVAELDALPSALRDYLDRAEKRIAQLHAHAEEVRRLRDRIAARLERLSRSG